MFDQGSQCNNVLQYKFKTNQNQKAESGKKKFSDKKLSPGGMYSSLYYH